MIGYVTMGTDDLDRARGFYAALLGTIGASELMRMSDEEANGFTLYGTGWGQPGIAVTRPGCSDMLTLCSARTPGKLFVTPDRVRIGSDTEIRRVGAG